MNTIINIHNIAPSQAPLVYRQAEPAPDSSVSSLVEPLGQDRVDFSRFGQALSQAAERSSLSIARTRAIRVQIENGTYETPERIRHTVDRLIDVIA